MWARWWSRRDTRGKHGYDGKAGTGMAEVERGLGGWAGEIPAFAGMTGKGVGMTEFWEGGRWRGGLVVVAARYPWRGAGMTGSLGAWGVTGKRVGRLHVGSVVVTARYPWQARV